MDRRESRRTIVIGAGLLALVLAALGLSYRPIGVSERQGETSDELAQGGFAPAIGVTSTAATLPTVTPTPQVRLTQRSEKAATQVVSHQATGTPRSNGSSWDPGSGTLFEPRVRPTEPAVPPDMPPAGITATPQPPITARGIEDMNGWLQRARPSRVPYYKAYVGYWRVVAQAYRTGDTSKLADVLTGDALAAASARVDERRRQGRGMEIRIRTNSLSPLGIEPDSFDMVHEYVDASVLIDIKSGSPVAPAGGGEAEAHRYKQLTHFRKVNGQLKVSSVNVYEIPEFSP